MTRQQVIGFLVGGTVLLCGIVSSGVVVVGPGESVVVRRFGRVLQDAWGPGLHLGLPRGIDCFERLRLEEVRRIEVGLAGLAGPKDDPGAGEFLTGDLNLLHARAVVHYRISDAVKYVFATNNCEEILSRLSEASLARALTRAGIDNVMREGRAEVAAVMYSDLDERLAAYGLGLRMLGVSLTDVQVPIEVQPEFAAAQSALSDKERRSYEAKSVAETMLIAAKANAKATEEKARAKAKRVIVLAQAQAQSFVTLLAEFDRSRHLTVRSLYLNAIRELTPKIRRKILLTPDESIDVSIFGTEPTGSR